MEEAWPEESEIIKVSDVLVTPLFQGRILLTLSQPSGRGYSFLLDSKPWKTNNKSLPELLAEALIKALGHSNQDS